MALPEINWHVSLKGELDFLLYSLRKGRNTAEVLIESVTSTESDCMVLDHIFKIVSQTFPELTEDQWLFYSCSQTLAYMFREFEGKGVLKCNCLHRFQTILNEYHALVHLRTVPKKTNNAAKDLFGAIEREDDRT